MTRRGQTSLPAPARCGVCDRPSTLALCDACDEPMCADHVTSRVVEGKHEYVCTLCALMLEEQQATPAVGAA